MSFAQTASLGDDFGPGSPLLFKLHEICLVALLKNRQNWCQILRLECTKFDFGWGSTPDPAGGAYSAPPDPLLNVRGSTSLPTCLLLTDVAFCQRDIGVIARTRYINVLTYLLTSVVL